MGLFNFSTNSEIHVLDQKKIGKFLRLFKDLLASSCVKCLSAFWTSRHKGHLCERLFNKKEEAAEDEISSQSKHGCGLNTYNIYQSCKNPLVVSTISTQCQIFLNKELTPANKV